MADENRRERHVAYDDPSLAAARERPLEQDWDIRREGHAWQGDEVWRKYYRAPEKIELVGGMVFGTAEMRLAMLGLLLENLGADVAVRFGDPRVWREVVAALDRETEG